MFNKLIVNRLPERSSLKKLGMTPETKQKIEWAVEEIVIKYEIGH